MKQQYCSIPCAAHDAPLSLHTRREFVTAIASVGAFAFASPVLGDPSASAPKDDWRWLVGTWDVWHRRLKERLAGSDDWQEFGGKSALWLTMGGLGTIDDNIVELPGDTYRGLTLRSFDGSTGKWAIWWLDGRNPARLEPPVLGEFKGDAATFFGRDTFRGRPITVRFRWNDIHARRPWWEQAFSTDEGTSWEVNWRNYFTRTSAEPVLLPKMSSVPSDFDFLVGRWHVRHRRLKTRFSGSHEWEDFDGTLTNWPVLGGHGNVGDNVMNFPSNVVRGIGLRAYDPSKKEWLSWWLDTRESHVIAPPMRGSFKDGCGVFEGEDTQNGHTIRTRVRWSDITPRSARWEQAGSIDGGRTWEENWVSTFERIA
jgi:hypothetical protein